MSATSHISPEQAFDIDFGAFDNPAQMDLEVPPAAAAAMLDMDVADLEVYLADVEASLDERAAALLQRPGWIEAVSTLAVPTGGTVMAIGDSITTYRRSYARLLAALLRQAAPEAGIRFINRGFSGFTSSLGLECTYGNFLAQQPDWLFVKYGVNDTKRFGDAPEKTLVSRDEYRLNMRGIVEAFLKHSSARIVLLTPTPVVEQLTNSLPDFQACRMTWRNADLEAFATVVREIGARYNLPVVDLLDAFGPDPDPQLYLDDGLHPGPEGQVLILERVIETLGTAETQSL